MCEQIEQILAQLTETLDKKDKALSEFKVQHKIRVMGEDEDDSERAPPQQAQASSSSGSAGVLV